MGSLIYSDCVYDINFLKKLVAYKEYDKLVAEKAIKKFVNHLWYLGDECVALTIFDERIRLEDRNNIAKKMLFDKEENESENFRKKLQIKIDDLEYFLNKDLPLQIITSKSTKLFERFQIPKDFLQVDPVYWQNEESYLKGKKIATSIKVVNDTAERGVKLIEEFNTQFTKDESQKQFILQTVQEYRKKYPTHNRDILRNPYN